MSAKKGLSSTLRNLKFMQRAAVAQKLEEKVDVEVVLPAANAGGAGSSVQVARKCVVVMDGNPHPGAVKGRMSFLNFNPSIDKLNDEASGRPTQSASPSNSHQDNANTTSVVVMEGNPHPGAVKGRMSFLNFNPSIDKLNDEASGRPTQSASPSNSHQDNANTTRTDDVSAASRFRDFNIDSSESISLNELKRKEPELEMETPPSRKLPKTAAQNGDGQSSSQSNCFGSRSRKSNKKREKLDYNLLRQRKS